jgi:hypothetical protein
MTTTQQKLLDLFNESLGDFFLRECDNIISGISERNLCGRLAVYIDRLLPKHLLEDYYVADSEYNRMQNGQIKMIVNEQMEEIAISCDLIVHSRGENIKNDNLIAVEMKKSTRPNREKEKDKIRLRALTRKSFDGIWSNDGKTYPEYVCGYEIGFYIEIDIENRSCEIETYSDGKAVKHWRTTF